MTRWCPGALGLALLTAVAPARAQQSEPAELRERILERMEYELARVTDYTCQQTIQRFSGFGDNPWRANDTLRLEVGLSGDKEMYSWPGARQFNDNELADMIGRGAVGTGLFALLARHVFQRGAAEFQWRGEETRNGRDAYRYDYFVTKEHSSYRVRTGGGEAVVGFEGSFWIDRTSLELLRLEVHAVNVPEGLALAQADNTMNYSRVAIGERELSLPVNSELVMVATTGERTRNVLELSGCRQFQGESTISFGAAPDTAPSAGTAQPRIEEFILPSGTQIEVQLRDDIEFGKAAIGNTVFAVLAKEVKDGKDVLLPQGTEITGRLVNIERQSIPFAMYEVAIALSAMTMDGKEVPFTATMEEASSASGLIRESRSMSPTFNRRRSPRLDILVNANSPGQGVLHWDAKKDRIPRGFKMKWRVE